MDRSVLQLVCAGLALLFLVLAWGEVRNTSRSRMARIYLVLALLCGIALALAWAWPAREGVQIIGQ